METYLMFSFWMNLFVVLICGLVISFGTFPIPIKRTIGETTLKLFVSFALVLWSGILLWG